MTISTTIQRLDAVAGLVLREHEPLAEHVTMGVGGPARWFAVPEHPAALKEALDILRGGPLPWMVLGGGSNTIFGDQGWPGVILNLGRGFRDLKPGPLPHQVTAGTATPLSAVMNFAKRHGLAGLEFTAGIPGTLGGALWGNAGTPQGDVCSLTEQVEVIDTEGRRLSRRRGEFSYAYRTSGLQGDILMEAILGLTPDAPEAIQQRIEATLAKRRTQPLKARTSGCMFKNPPGDSAGRLIDAAGLKGARVGAMKVAEEHANFMVNEGGAMAGDVWRLVTLVRDRVRERFGVELTLEVRMVGLDFGQKIP